jgi:HSP20 family protein
MAQEKIDVTRAPAPATRPSPSFTDGLIEPLSRLRSEVDRLFDDFPFRMPTLQFGRLTQGLNVPAVEMTETGKAYKITAELPGMAAENVDVSFEDGMLRIAGEKKEEREENERGYRLSERSYGSFERLIDLPAAADDTKIKARFKNGVLTVTVPKDEKAEPSSRRIAVEQA